MNAKALRYSVAMLFIFANAFNVSSQNLFSKTYGGSLHDEFHAAAVTTGHGFIMTGLAKSFGDTSGNAIIVKADSNGNAQFIKNYGGSKLDGGNAIIQTIDGGYLVAGHTQSYSNDCDGLVIKLNANGDSIWGRIFGNPDDDALSAVLQTTDGGFIFTGYSEHYSSNLIDVYIVKTDVYGSIQWQKFIGGDSIQMATSIKQCVDGGYILTGKTTISGNNDVFLLKTDANGDSLWMKKFGGVGDERAYSVVITSDGGYAIAGLTSSTGAGMLDLYLLKTDASGNFLWQNTFGGANDDAALDVKTTMDGGFILTGATKSFGDFAGDIYLVKTDASGAMQWTKTIGGIGDDGAMSVMIAADRGYVAAGYTSCFGNGGYDCFLVKTDSSGNNVTGIKNNIVSDNIFNVYPNPANDLVNISFLKAGSENSSIYLTDLSGRKIKEWNEGKKFNDQTISLDISSVSQGTYLMVVSEGDKRAVKKIVVER